VIRRSRVGKVEGHYHLALLGLQVLDLKLPSAVCFPFHSDPINKGLGGISVAMATVKYTTGSLKVSGCSTLSL